MNLIEKAIAVVSPKRALQRARYRRALEVSLAYDGAKQGRFSEGWTTTGASANAELGPSLARLRERSRDLERNNPYALRAIADLCGLAIGTGATPKHSSDAVSAAFERWMEVCDADGQLDFFGIQNLVARTVLLSGEAIVRLRNRRPGEMEIPLQLQVMEGDHLDHNKTEQLTNGYILQGVEFDALGRRIAYWLFQTHPGDILENRPWVLTRGYQSARVHASEILHIYNKAMGRPGQVRGEPWLRAVITTLRNLDDFEDAEIVRKKIEACLAAFIIQPDGIDGPSAGQVDYSDGKRIEAFEPGMVKYVRPGEEIRFNEPKGQGGYADYLACNQGKIAAGTGMMRWQMSGNLAEINYSAFRAGQSVQRTGLDAFRWLTMVPMFLQPVYRRVIETAAAAGVVSQDNSVEWMFPPYPSVDPYKDAQATLAEIRMGTKTWPQAVAERGYDPRRQIEEIEQSNADFDSAGIVLDCDPRHDLESEQGEGEGDATNNSKAAA
jgi:lambda family phage portal protein